MSSLTSPFASSATSSFLPSTFGGNNFSIAIMGAPGVGKSAIIHQFVHNTFLKGYWATVKESYRTKTDIDGRNVTLNIFDTPGAYCFSNVRKLAITNADAFVLVYHVGDESSFEMMAEIREMIVQQKPAGVPVIIVGNKTDLTNPVRFMSKEKAQCIVTTAWKHDYMEVSAKDHDNVCDIFQNIVSQAHSFHIQTRRRTSTPTILLQNISRRFRRTKSLV